MKNKLVLIIFLGFLLVFFGNNSFAFAEDLDTTPPVGTISINNGDLYTNNREVTLTLSAEDPSGVSEMKIANHTSYHEWETYTEVKSWTLSLGDGEKIVRVKFKDTLGNETITGIPAKITLDTVPPVISLIGESNINLKLGDVYVDQGVTASDDITPDLTSDVSLGGTYIDTSKEGSYTITYDVKDLAGNMASQVVRTINILKGEETTTPTLVNLSITKPADKLSYKIGENLDITGLEVTGTYSDNSTKVETITDGNVTGFDSSLVASGQILTITVGLSTTTYTINISKVDDGSSGGDTNSDILINDNVEIDSDCEIVDTDGLTHVFNKEDSSSGFLAICALKEALDKNIINELSLKNDQSLGLYVESINSIKPSNTEYWSVWLNEGYANCGVGCLSVSNGDVLSLILTDWMTETETSEITLNIKTLSPTPVNQSGGSSGASGYNSKEFSVEKAFQFLISKQNDDGSYTNQMYTDWVAIALSLEKGDLKEKTKNYLIANDINSPIVTENERRAMSLMSLGINPYNGTSVDYINKIIKSFDGVQIGDSVLINDDIFGLIVLQNVGYDEKDEIIKKVILYILENQSEDGSWGSVDMTAAAIMSLEKFKEVPDVSDAISLAKDYLLELQDDNGNFENIFATSWAIQALSSDDSYDSEVKRGINYLAHNQNDDGGLIDESINNRVWSTAYAIPAVLELSWNDILLEFSKPVEDPKAILLSDNVLEKKTLEISKNKESKKTIEKFDETPELQSLDQKEDLLERNDGIDESDLLASSGLSTEGNSVSGKTLILFLGTILVLFSINFVIRWKF